ESQRDYGIVTGAVGSCKHLLTAREAHHSIVSETARAAAVRCAISQATHLSRPPSRADGKHVRRYVEHFRRPAVRPRHATPRSRALCTQHSTARSACRGTDAVSGTGRRSRRDTAPVEPTGPPHADHARSGT